MAEEIGFQFVDVKHCHGYLGHEFLSAFDRPGLYGGDFEGRTRFMREIVQGIKSETKLPIGVRLSAFDTLPYKPDDTKATTPERTTNAGPVTKSFTVEAFKFGFTPAVIEVNEGDTVKLIVKSTQGNHGIGIPQFKVDVKVNEGEEKTTEFIADKKGEYSFFCNVYCGEGHKLMKGKLMVK